MVRPDVHKASITLDVVDAVGIRARHFRAGEVVSLDQARLLLRAPLSTAIGVVSDQLLLLGVHGDNGHTLRQALLHLRVDVSELRIPVRVVGPLLSLSIAL